VVKIGDLGLARLIYKPLQPLYAGDKVVVTIWYRAPELLLGAKHYTTAIDCWAVGCVMAELISLRPIFKGEEAKLDSKKIMPFQRDQLLKIFEVLGTPDGQWSGIWLSALHPKYQLLAREILARDCELTGISQYVASWLVRAENKRRLWCLRDLLPAFRTNSLNGASKELVEMP